MQLTPRERIRLRRRACSRIALALADLPEMKDRAIDTERIELIVDMEMPQHIADAQAESDELDAKLRETGVIKPRKPGPNYLERLRVALGLTDKQVDIGQVLEAAIERIEKGKRDDATCQRCLVRYKHSMPTYECHHIKPFEVREHRVNPDNVILLCRRCHKWVHSRKNTRKRFIGRRTRSCRGPHRLRNRRER